MLGVLSLGFLHAEGVSGSIEWSDGRKISGDISLVPGKQLELAMDDTIPTIFRLGDVREIRTSTEKEEMYEGWYYSDAGKTIKEKTGEVYPIRYLRTQITLKDGRVMQGHLYTTMLSCESDESTEKVLLIAKQSGVDGQKLTDLIYPAVIRLTLDDVNPGSLTIDLSKSKLTGIKQVEVVSKPELLPLITKKAENESLIWKVPWGDPKKIIFMVECSDGFHVECPKQSGPDWSTTIKSSLLVMEDFYDKRTLLGFFSESENQDLYSFVLMQRTKGYLDLAGNPLPSKQKPWEVDVLRWKYVAQTKQIIFQNRVGLVKGRSDGQTGLPVVVKDSTLLSAITLDFPASRGTVKP